MKRTILAAAIALVAAATPAAADSSLSTARSATAPFHQVSTAIDAGYGRFLDKNGVACIDHGADGAMGIHYVNGALVGDPAIDAETPEALVYEPESGGRLRLVAVEYIVFREAWDATHNDAPRLFGQEFEPIGADNRYGIPAFYELHAWVWKHNPSGRFDDWNPRVSC
jgi:hypothetical protein